MEELIKTYELDLVKLQLQQESAEVINNIKLILLQTRIRGLNAVLMIFTMELIQEIRILDITDRKYLEKLAEELREVNYGNVEELREFLFLTATMLLELQMENVYSVYLKTLRLVSELLVINQI